MNVDMAESWFIDESFSSGHLDFASEEGKKVFFEACSTGYLNCYFKQAEQFLTSFEPDYGCGLATLTMVLNTLNADPGRIWKDQYRWYKETMLEHCVPYNIIEKNGITFQQFACMVECKHLRVELACLANHSASVDDFGDICKRITSGNCKEILVVNYGRSAMNQVGLGHFCPIGGYHPGRDLVLLFDSARYKYPLHWASLENLWQGMKAIDVITGCPRGYFILRKPQEETKPNLLFKIVGQFDNKNPCKQWLTFLRTVFLPWHDATKSLESNGIMPGVLLDNVINAFLEILVKSECLGNPHLHGVHMHLEFQTVDPSLGKECMVCKLREEIETTNLYCTVIDRIKNMEYNKYKLCECWKKLFNQVVEGQKPLEVKCCQITQQPSACHLREFNLAHFIVVVLFSWPYEISNNDENTRESRASHGANMKSIIDKELSTAKGVLKEEVRNIRDRFLSAA